MGGCETMPLFEDNHISESIEIRTQPEDIFGFLTNIVDDKSYRQWHSKDHVRFKWVHGRPWAKGSVFYAEEYLHGKLHKFKFEIAEIEPPERIEYRPVSRLLRFFFPKNEFIIEKKGGVSIFTASGTFRVGWIGKTFFSKSINKGLASVREHMKEEGENLKMLLEMG